MPLVIALLLGLAALLIVVYPLLGLEAAGASADDALAEVGEQESSARQALRDVDFDRRLGNLDDADYRALREGLEERALEAMKARYARERALDAHIEHQLAALRTERRPGSASAKAARSATSPASAQTRKPARSATPPAGTPRNAAESATPPTGVEMEVAPIMADSSPDGSFPPQPEGGVMPPVGDPAHWGTGKGSGSSPKQNGKGLGSRRRGA